MLCSGFRPHCPRLGAFRSDLRGRRGRRHGSRGRKSTSLDELTRDSEFPLDRALRDGDVVMFDHSGAHQLVRSKVRYPRNTMDLAPLPGTVGRRPHL